MDPGNRPSASRIPGSTKFRGLVIQEPAGDEGEHLALPVGQDRESLGRLGRRSPPTTRASTVRGRAGVLPPE